MEEHILRIIKDKSVSIRILNVVLLSNKIFKKRETMLKEPKDSESKGKY